MDTYTGIYIQHVAANFIHEKSKTHPTRKDTLPILESKPRSETMLPGIPQCSMWKANFPPTSRRIPPWDSRVSYKTIPPTSQLCCLNGVILFYRAVVLAQTNRHNTWLTMKYITVFFLLSLFRCVIFLKQKFIIRQPENCGGRPIGDPTM